jgi:2-hydroxy-3-keto-5-methylthiopentenyl-1-phosphate phosphatase
MLFIVDFDGTVAPTDTVDALLERFADPAWHRVEEQWVAGQLNSRECMKAQLSLVTAERETVKTFLQSVAIDPFFAGFVRYASTFAEVAVVSDGLDYPIQHALQKLNIPPIPVYANRLEFRAHGLDITFPHTDATCMPRSGVCKCAVARSLNVDRGLSTVLIGDGRSDRCLAQSADYVFAKGALRGYCEDKGITYTPFDSFNDILAVIKKWDTALFNKAPREKPCRLAAQ